MPLIQRLNMLRSIPRRAFQLHPVPAVLVLDDLAYAPVRVGMQGDNLCAFWQACKALGVGEVLLWLGEGIGFLNSVGVGFLPSVVFFLWHDRFDVRLAFLFRYFDAMIAVINHGFFLPP